MNVRVEYEPLAIRRIAIQCPDCLKWFRGYEITDDKLRFESDIKFAKYYCPVCEKHFGCECYFNSDIKIEEVEYPDIYKDCLSKKVTWE